MVPKTQMHCIYNSLSFKTTKHFQYHATETCSEPRRWQFCD